MSSLLLHRHLWVRKAAGRLLGGLFAALPQPTRDPPGWAAGTVLFPPEGLQHVAASLCQQLEAEVVDDKLAEQGVKNLVYVATAMHAVLEAGVKPGVNGRPNGEHVGNGLGNGLAIGAEEDLEAGEADEVEEGSEEGRWQRERCPTLKSLFRRIARIALRVEPIQVSMNGGETPAVILRWSMIVSRFRLLYVLLAVIQLWCG